MNRKKIDKKLPFLKKKTDKSLEKSADSFMNISNKLWGFVFISIISIPIAFLLKSDNERISSMHDLMAISVKYSLVLYSILFLLFIGACFAYILRGWALYIYDYLDAKDE